MAERSVLVRIRGNSNDLVRATAAARAAIGGLRQEIDTTNQRTAWMAQSFLALGPALVPLGATAVPVLAGLATQMTAAGLAAGSVGLAFIGLGDSMKAVNEYQLEPSAENFAKMRMELEDFGPAGAEFVGFLQTVGPEFDQLQLAAREGMFPGMETGIRAFMDVLPQAERVISNVSEAIGTLSTEAGQGLGGERFEEFFDYLENEAAPILLDMGHAFGNLADGFGAILEAFGPLTADFSDGFVGMSRAFADWAHGLDESQSFAEFVDYIRDAVPKALGFLDSLAGAFVQILEAAAPVGDVMLPVLSSFLDVIGAIADTPLGPMFLTAAAGMSAYGRAAALAKITTGGLASSLLGVDKGFGATLRGADGAIAKMGAVKTAGRIAAGGVGLLALSLTDVDDKMGVANTAMGTMAGLMIGGPWGAAIGGGIGLVADFKARQGEASAEAEELAQTLDQQTGAITANTREWTRRKLLDEGALDAARELGLNLDIVTNAALGNKNAIDQVNTTYSLHQQELQKSAEETGIFDEKLAKQGDEWHLVRTAIGDTNKTMDDARDRLSLMGGAMHGSTQEMRRAERAMQDFRHEVERTNRFLSKRASFRDYEASLDDLADTLDKVKDKSKLLNEDGTINIDLPKGREVQERLDAIADTAIKLAEGLRGTARVEALKQARRDFVDMAEKVGLSDQAIRFLTRRIFAMPIKRAVEIVVKTEKANGNLDELRRQLDSIDYDRYIKIGVRAPNLSGFGAQITPADGATVPGPRQPYGDKIHALLAPGEEVISNRFGQADRNRDLLKAINANRYADGGTISVHATASLPAGFPAQAGPAIDYDRLAVAMSRVRPMFGDVTVNGDRSFEREMRQQRQRQNLGGH